MCHRKGVELGLGLGLMNFLRRTTVYQMPVAAFIRCPGPVGFLRRQRIATRDVVVSQSRPRTQRRDGENQA